MDKEIINTIDYGQRVTSTYAELYLEDSYCEEWDKKYENAEADIDGHEEICAKERDEWISPSDELIGKIELKPPFTSKITRGKTHEGILAIGDHVLEKQRIQFQKYLTKLLRDNDAAWSRILNQERQIVENKVKEIYKNIFIKKSEVMKQEMQLFFENSLQELENHMREEMRNVLVCTHASLIKDLNNEIKRKLRKEKNILEETLRSRYESEMYKIKDYYELLFNNEIARHNKLIISVTVERNDAVKAFLKQLEAENLTSTMYIMSMERRKCRIKHFLMESYQNKEVSDKIREIKERETLLEGFHAKSVPVTEINRQWQEKIRKVLELFLKFISFSLKLLPEQSSFLLDLEKLFVLQLNETQKQPIKAPSILIDADKLQNMFHFDKCDSPAQKCSIEPFEIVGDLSDTPPVVYGSRETLPDDVDLPTIRLQRQFVYAKCHNYEEIKEHLNAQKCKCRHYSPIKTPSPAPSTSDLDKLSSNPVSAKSSTEPFLVEDIHRLQQCPLRKCTNVIKRLAFPNLQNYVEFSDENYTRAKVLCEQPLEETGLPELLKAKDMAYRKVPFAATTEPYHNVGTQYSSQESIYQPEIGCTCIEPAVAPRSEPHYRMNDTALEMKRKQSVAQLLGEHHELLDMFTDENFDFQL